MKDMECMKENRMRSGEPLSAFVPEVPRVAVFPPSTPDTRPSSRIFPPRHPTPDTHRFTLIELLAAISIIAILMALIVGASSMASRKGATSKTLSMLKQMEIALEQAYQDRGYYPQQTVAAVLAWPVVNFTSTTGKVYLDNYDPDRFKDAWGRQFLYQCPGVMNPEKYDLWSMGPDGAHGKVGVDDNNDTTIDNAADSQCTAADMSDDIASWKRNE